MKGLNLDFIVANTGGTLLSEMNSYFDKVATDTRKDMQGQLFVALKGDAFDAHHFLEKAVEQGATGLLVHEVTNTVRELAEQVTVILVKDTLVALQDLARGVRFAQSAKVVGIAGSNGKTTSKEFTAGLIAQFRDVHYAKGSFNNHWGVPFTLLAQPENAEVSVVEMGMNHSGELTVLANIACPDVVVCTYVGVEHIEFFGNLENIAAAEEEIYLHSPEAAVRIYNLDNQYTAKMHAQHTARFPRSKAMTFSESRSANVSLRIQELSMQSMTVIGQIAGVTGTATVQVFGKHNLTNLMVAASCALATGLTPEQIWTGLTACKTNWGRNQLVHAASGALILFDAYNANPDSVKALVDNMPLVKSTGRKIGVFAEMRELGDLAAKLHEETGRFVAQGNLDSIWFYGPHHKEFCAGLRSAGFKGELQSSADFDESIAAGLAGGLGASDIALVKGSRGMQLERFVRLAKPVDFVEKE